MGAFAQASFPAAEAPFCAVAMPGASQKSYTPEGASSLPLPQGPAAHMGLEHENSKGSSWCTASKTFRLECVVLGGPLEREAVYYVPKVFIQH